MKNIIAILVAIIWLSNQAMAAGFQSSQMSVADLGYAYAGAASSIEDTGVVYNNPAGMVFRDNNSAQVSLYQVNAKAAFTNNGSSKAALAGGAALTGANADGGTNNIVPNIYVHKKYDGFDVGASINAPFGSSTEYDKNWVGRYNAIKTDLKVLNINVSVAKKINDKLAISGGINHQKADVLLSNAIDYDTISKGINPALSASDGYAELSGDDTAIGYNVGLMYKINDASTLGIAYRSETDFSLTGKANITEPDDLHALVSGGLAAQNNLQDANISSKLVLPSQLSIGFNTQLNSQTTVYVNASWTDWGVMEKLVIDYDSNQADTVSTFNWKDTSKIAAGIGYQYNDQWKLRFGVASDSSPANDINRSPRSPGGKLNWITAGASYQYSQDLQVDFGIAHVDGGTTNSNTQVESSVAALQSSLLGSYDNAASIIGAQLVWKF